ncbi:MAG: hypothetical protein ACI82F_001180 [Planctomycetota bacterium]|jgi:hypothetical protein
MRFRGFDAGTTSAKAYTLGSGLFGDDPFADDSETTLALDDQGSFDIALQEGRDYALTIEATRLSGHFYRQVTGDSLPANIEREIGLAQLNLQIPPALADRTNRLDVFIRWSRDGWIFDQPLRRSAPQLGSNGIRGTHLHCTRSRAWHQPDLRALLMPLASNSPPQRPGSEVRRQVACRSETKPGLSRRGHSVLMQVMEHVPGFGQV